jgi:hypothetical protein
MSDTRIAKGKRDKSGGSRRHVGGASERRLSRGSQVVTGGSPYIPCMWECVPLLCAANLPRIKNPVMLCIFGRKPLQA